MTAVRSGMHRIGGQRAPQQLDGVANPAVPPTFGSEMIITDTVVHEMDTVRWLLGEESTGARVDTPRSTRRAAGGVHDPLFVVVQTASPGRRERSALEPRPRLHSEPRRLVGHRA